MRLNVKSFLSFYAIHVFQPNKSQRGDTRYPLLTPKEQVVALTLSIALGIFTLGLYHAGLAIKEQIKKVKAAPIDEKIRNIAAKGQLSTADKQASWKESFDKAPDLKKWFEKEFCSKRRKSGYKTAPGFLPALSEKQIRQAKEFYEALPEVSDLSTNIFERGNSWLYAASIKKIPRDRLDDGAMDAILLLFKESQKNLLVEVTSTAFYDFIVIPSRSYKKLDEWSATAWQEGKLLIPILQGEGVGAHATLLVADLKNKVIEHFDSLGASGTIAMKNVGKYLNEQLQKYGFKGVNWKMKEAKHRSKQDLDDCSVFTLFFTESLLKGTSKQKVNGTYDFNFRSENVPYYRLLLLYQISENFHSRQ